VPERLLTNLRALVALAAIWVMPTRAVADGDPPWGRGVSAANKAAAQRLLEEGNQLFLANRHKDALATYEAAVARWDHPAIRFNLVRTQVALDKLIEAYDNLEKALAYGAEALEDGVYAEALNYQRLLARQVAELEVRCNQPGVELKIDGDVRVPCPAERKVRMSPGRHVVTGTGKALTTVARDLFLEAGKLTTVEIHLEPVDAVNLVMRPRWARWKPWAVVAGGVVVTGVGAVFNYAARRDADEVDRRSRISCTTGCTDEDYRALGLADLESRVRRSNAISLTSLAVGTATLLVGGALVVANRPRLHVHETSASVSIDDHAVRVALTTRF